MMEIYKIYNEDCINVMQRMDENSIDFIVTDPPYLFDTTGEGSSTLAKRAKTMKKNIDFISHDFDYNNCFEHFLRICKIPNMIIFCSNKQIGRTMTFFEQKGLVATLLIWQKTNPIPACNNKYISECEYAIYVRDKGAFFNNDTPMEWKKKVYTSPICPDGKLHPTMKPVDLIRRYLLVHSKPNDVVFDPFMGSGTTAIACIKENRHYIGCEIDQKYYKVTIDRIEREKRTPTLF
jgi:DNA modification methylase